MTLFFWIYNLLFIPLFFILVHIAALFNRKIRKGLLGRYQQAKELKRSLAKISGKQRVWMHVSSMGEFEQAKPVIDRVLEKFPHAMVILTVFSPSAFDHLALDDERILMVYLPIDTWFHAQSFIKKIQPHATLVVRHDIWPNFQWVLHKSGIPSFLIDASISDKRHWVYKLFQLPIRSVMQTFDQVHTVSEKSAQRYVMLYPDADNIKVFGDTRYDRVVQRSQNVAKIKWLLDKNLFDPERTCVLGSTWPSGEKHWLPAIRKVLDAGHQFRVILAPHEVDDDHIQSLITELEQLKLRYVTMSDLENETPDAFDVLIVDRIGVLANLYTCGKLAYVGGGFGPGVHNVLEPAAHGCMVLFGPRYDVSVEPIELIHAGGGKVVNNGKDIQNILTTFLTEPASCNKSGEMARQFIENHTGASEKIVNCITNILPQ